MNDFKCKVKPRYRKEESGAEIHMLDDTNAKVTFKEKQRAITKGQSAVFYDCDIVLGGGIIAEYDFRFISVSKMVSRAIK